MTEKKYEVDLRGVLMDSVLAWLDKNNENIQATTKTALENAVQVSTQVAIETMACGIMVEIRKFLNANREDLIAAIASAMAANHNSGKE